MRFARWVFLAAGVYGLIVIAPLYFLEGQVARVSVPIAHPEYYYGWVSAAFVFQLMFLLISRDPVRFRPFMIIGVLEKFTWIVSLWTLAALHRVSGGPLYVGSLDAVWGVLFLIAWMRTPPAASSS